MEDAACRALANAKATTGLIAGVDDIRVPPPVTNEETQRALRNINHCVVGLLSRWEETKAVLEFWFPWLDFSVDSYRRKMFIYRYTEGLFIPNPLSSTVHNYVYGPYLIHSYLRYYVH